MDRLFQGNSHCSVDTVCWCVTITDPKRSRTTGEQTQWTEENMWTTSAALHPPLSNHQKLSKIKLFLAWSLLVLLLTRKRGFYTKTPELFPPFNWNKKIWTPPSYLGLFPSCLPASYGNYKLFFQITWGSGKKKRTQHWVDYDRIMDKWVLCH